MNTVNKCQKIIYCKDKKHEEREPFCGAEFDPEKKPQQNHDFKQIRQKPAIVILKKNGKRIQGAFNFPKEAADIQIWPKKKENKLKRQPICRDGKEEPTGTCMKKARTQVLP
ncbi:MAG: hypothetical protein PUA61_04445 [Succinatimonas hippei]|nr:hypothetical protein [Succinatimonas hippei]